MFNLPSKFLVRYFPTILMAAFTLVVSGEILVFSVIGGVDWNHLDDYFVQFDNFPGNLLWQPIGVSIVVAFVPIIYGAKFLHIFLPGSTIENLFETLGLMECKSGFCDPTLGATIGGLIFYTLVIALVNYYTVMQKFSRLSRLVVYILLFLLIAFLSMLG